MITTLAEARNVIGSTMLSDWLNLTEGEEGEEGEEGHQSDDR